VCLCGIVGGQFSGNTQRQPSCGGQVGQVVQSRLAGDVRPYPHCLGFQVVLRIYRSAKDFGRTHGDVGAACPNGGCDDVAQYCAVDQGVDATWCMTPNVCRQVGAAVDDYVSAQGFQQ